jgi:KaiC/GvpD/RAD55 family RecA-like ATPase
LEEAKILDRKGEYVASSGKYGSATERFQKAIEIIELEPDRREFKPIVCLCRAWQLMMRAEAEASPELYLEASRFFDEAKEQSFDEKAKLLALGHSCFCKALEAGRRFEVSRDEALHSAATQHLEGAAGFYFRAGFKDASEYAKATQRFFDAQMYMHKAKTEMNPLQKAQYYQMSEKLLRASAGSYMRAKKPEKGEDVRRLLESIEEERELAMSLTEVFHAPSIVSTTTSFLTPTPTLEKAVGLERFEHANVQADVGIDAKEIRVGEDFSLEMQITNVGKGAVLLVEVEEVLPRGFELVVKPDYCHFQDTCLDMKGKRLDPLKTEKIRLVLRSFDKGTFKISPRIVYVDETGHRMVSETKPVAIDVFEVILPGRITVGYGDLDDLLFGGIPENYSVILTSPSCDEKDLLIKSFLESGIRDGQVTFLVTVGTSGVKTLAETFQTSFYIFICNPQADTMVEGSPNVFRLKGVENLTEITIALTKALRTLDASLSRPRRACIGIVSDVLLQHHAVQTRRWLNDLIPELRSKGFTTLAVMNPQMHPPEEVQAMLELFDGEISIYERETKNGPEKSMKIKKMVNQRYLESELPLRKERLKP